MPALVFCSRRWRIGSDDFVLPGLVEILVRLAWLVLVLLLFIEHEQVNCNQGSTELRIFLGGVMALLIVVITVTIMLVVFSARGSVMDGDRRQAVPTILMIRVILGFPEVGWNLLGSIWIFSGKIDCNDHAPLWILLKALLAVTWVALLLLMLTIVLLFEPMHRPEPLPPPGRTLHHVHPPLMVTSSTSFALDSNMGSHYIQLWERRCRILCCASSKDETSLEALRNVADVLASIFEDNDLVASDIAAALVLLRLKQKYQEKREKRAIAQRKLEEEERQEEGRQTNGEQSGIAEEAIAVTNHHSRQNLENSCDNTSSQAAAGAAAAAAAGGDGRASVQLTEAPPPQYKWMTLANARHFMRFALASYGWPWYVYGQCFTSMRAMWSFLYCCTPCCCRARPPAVHGDNCCLCHLAAMRAITGLTIDNFLYVYYYNNIYEVPFIVVVDDVTHSLVVAIRGTLSLKDAITDMTAQTEPVFPLTGEADDDDVEETDRTRFLAHKGMVHAADFVYQKLKETQVLAHARVQYPDYQVVVTGHSLGAGAAVVLAARLRLDEQRRCRAALKKTRKRKSQKGVPSDGVSNHGYVDPQDGSDKKGIGDTPCNIVCYAYSPPGGLCSEAFAKLTRSFVMSVVVGDDIVPRLSMHSLHDLRVSIVRVLEDCHQPKYRLLAQGCWFMLFGISEGNLRKGFEDSHGNSQRRRRRRLEDVERHERDGEVGRRDEGSVTPSPTSSQPLLAIATTQPCRNYESTENISSPAGLLDSAGATNTSTLSTDVLSEDASQENAADQARRRRSIHTPRHMETTLQLPGYILHVKPSGINTPWLWQVSWQSPEFFRELLISPWMLRHHLPQEVMKALNTVMEMPELRQEGPTNLA